MSHNMFPHMSHNNLQLGKPVKHTIHHQTKDMQTDPMREIIRTRGQPFPSLEELLHVLWDGQARVDVHWTLQVFRHQAPEGIPLGLVVEFHLGLAGGVGVLLEVVQDYADETELFDGTGGFFAGFGGVVH